MRTFISKELENKKFGRWLVVRFDKKVGGYRFWWCKCECGKEKSVKGYSLVSGKSKSCGCWMIENFKRGSDSPQWKENPSYFAIHAWLRKTFGKPNICENPKCKHSSEYYQWAKLKNKKYERKRENYIRLCHSCHTSYDMTDEWILKATKHMKKHG